MVFDIWLILKPLILELHNFSSAVEIFSKSKKSSFYLIAYMVFKRTLRQHIFSDTQILKFPFCYLSSNDFLKITEMRNCYFEIS